VSLKIETPIVFADAPYPKAVRDANLSWTFVPKVRCTAVLAILRLLPFEQSASRHVHCMNNGLDFRDR